MSEPSDVVAALRGALGDAVTSGGDIPERHFSDWTGHAPCRPLALACPASTADIAAALRICHEHRQPVVPQGGMTGMAGGAVPDAGSVALSLDRLSGVEAVDAAAGTLTARAGTTLEAVQQAASNAGFRYPVDFGARGSCQIGGTIATNAGGREVIRHGMTRDRVLGLEVVLADGTILDLMNTMIKNNTGYELVGQWRGSISAEHGIGLLKRDFLHYSVAPEVLTAMHTLKAAFDPQGILNPGRLLAGALNRDS